jgi:hypothetical protein
LTRTFVGIGFGPIQSGLFLFEAYRSGNFDRFVVSEIEPRVVHAVRRSGGQYWVNVAEPSCARSHRFSELEIYQPFEVDDQRELVSAIATADEIATALPSVDFFDRGSPSPAELLAQGLRRKLEDRDSPLAVVYVAENHNQAAERLRDSVRTALDPSERPWLDSRVQFVNTVIGKMGGVISDPFQIRLDGLVPLTEGCDRAILVEEFNRILISQITLPGFSRGITVFQEKPDLLPFEEAKLYGHNAAHALMGYLANHRGLTFMQEADSEGLSSLVEKAFLEESGEALCRRHLGLDSLFTAEGWTEYVHDLLMRMINPHLKDRVDRIIRDSRRKLGWDDRLIGTMRMALAYGIPPRRYSLGAAAAIDLLLKEQPRQTVASLLGSIWGESVDTDGCRSTILQYVEDAIMELGSCKTD